MSRDLDWIFFDVGGVLIDATAREKERRRILLRIVRKYDAKINASDVAKALDVASSSVGHLGAHTVNLLLADNSERARSLAMEEERLMWQRNSMQPPQPVRKEALRVCTALSKRYKLGIIANQPRSIRAVLQRAGLLDVFSHVGLSEELDLHKPDPRIFRRIMREAHTIPSRSAMIDDNYPRGLAPAKKLGMKTIWLRLSMTGKQHPADYKVSTLEGLLNIF